MHARTATPRNSLAIALQSSLLQVSSFAHKTTAQQFVRLFVHHTRPLLSSLSDCLCALGFWDGRQLALTARDIKPCVSLTAVVGFGKKRGPNSNPTS